MPLDDIGNVPEMLSSAKPADRGVRCPVVMARSDVNTCECAARPEEKPDC